MVTSLKGSPEYLLLILQHIFINSHIFNWVVVLGAGWAPTVIMRVLVISLLERLRVGVSSGRLVVRYWLLLRIVRVMIVRVHVRVIIIQINLLVQLLLLLLQNLVALSCLIQFCCVELLKIFFSL